jgi:transposase
MAVENVPLGAGPEAERRPESVGGCSADPATYAFPLTAEAYLIGLETHVLLRHYLDEGLSKRAIARLLGIDRRTITRWVAAGELDRDLDRPPFYRPRPPRPTKLDPYKGIIVQRLKDYPKLSAIRLLEEVQAAGYTGGYSQLRDYIRTVRPCPAPEPPNRFETPPGKQGQVDFAEFRFPWGKRYALVVVLGHSRHKWFRFFKRQDMRSLFQGLEEAFHFFGGVPEELLFDQMKAVITKDLRLLGGQLVVNQEFLRFAAHWGFIPRACRPYRARTKGKVERPIGYIRGNFVYGRAFLNDADLDEQRGRWLDKANRRVHRTTGEVPLVRFERDERHLLRPLAAEPYFSVLVPPVPVARSATPLPRVVVERRPLTAYAALVGGAL